MVYQLEVKVMGKDWLALGIKDTLDLWTPARWPASTFKLDLIKLNVVFVFRSFLFIFLFRWHPQKWTCFKLDLMALKRKIGTSRLRKISFLSRMRGGIRIHVHKPGQAYDENIGTEIISATSADPRYYLLTFVDLSLKVKKTIPTKHQRCEDTNYDEELLEKTTERMMASAGA